MLKALKLINFRSHADTTLLMEPMTLMVGPAGAGKSNVFRAMVILQNSIHRTLVEIFSGLGAFHWVRSRWAGETDPIGFEVKVDMSPEYPDCMASYSLKIADSPAGLYVLEETLSRRNGDQPDEWVFQRRRNRTAMGEFGTVEWDMPTTLHRVWHGMGVADQAPNVRFARSVAKALSSFGYYHLEVGELKELGTGQTSDRIRYRGEGLPDFMAWTRSETAGAPVYEQILSEMRQLLPSLEDIVITQAGADRQGLAFKFRDHRGYIAAPDVSDGTMLTLGLLCILDAPFKPKVLCIEEPETGLHPRRLRWLFEKLISTAYPSDNSPPTQVVLTTHSPSFVDLFKDMLESVQVVEQQDGRTRITPLSTILQKLHMGMQSGEGIGYEWATGLFEGL